MGLTSCRKGNYCLQKTTGEGMDTRPVILHRERAAIRGNFCKFCKLLHRDNISYYITAQMWKKYTKDTKIQIRIHMPLVLDNICLSA